MQISTTRFGFLTVQPEDVINFPLGILGLDDCRRWILFADGENEALAWLQSTSHPEVALAVVNPRRFVPNFQLRVSRYDMEPLELEHLKDAEVLAIVGRQGDAMTLNLKAPLVVNLPRQLGRQVIAKCDAPLQHVLTPLSSTSKGWKRVA